MTIIKTSKDLRPRQPRDYYPTQDSLCDAALDLVAGQVPKEIMDPGCGQGPWGKAAKVRWPGAAVTGVDIDPGICEEYDKVIKGDFLQLSKSTEPYDLIIGNPPYKFTEEFVRKSLDILSGNGQIIFLLRLNFLASRKRSTGLFKDHPPKAVYVLSTRPSFTGDNKADDSEYALFVWAAGNKAPTEVHWYDWKERTVCA